MIFDAMPMDQVAVTRIKVLEVVHDRLVLDDLGPGNCPTFSPDDARIAFLLNTAPQTGVWLMQADGRIGISWVRTAGRFGPRTAASS